MPTYNLKKAAEIAEKGCVPTIQAVSDKGAVECNGRGTDISPEAAKEGRGGLGFLMAAAFLVAEMSGSGVLALPRALANTGWWGLLLMLILCTAVGFAGTRLALCWVMLEERWPEYRVPCRRPYPEIAFRALGRIGSYMAVVAQQITLLGVSTVFLLLAAQLLTALTSHTSFNYSECTYIIVVGVALIPATWLATPKDFWIASVVAVFVMLSQLLVVIIKLAMEASSLPEPQYSSPSFSSFFLGSGSILFAFGGASTFPTIQNDMRDRAKFPISVTIAFVVLLIMYASMAGVGYGVLGSDVASNVLLSVSGTEVTVVRALIFTHLLFAFVIIFNPVAQAFEELCKVPHEFGWKRCVLRSSVVILEIILGMAVPDFGVILNLVGGSTIAFMSFVMPPLCYLRLSSAKDKRNRCYRNVSRLERAVLYGVMTVGVIGGGVTTYTAGAAIVGPGAFVRSCF